jgi:hypothetical protein
MTNKRRLNNNSKLLTSTSSSGSSASALKTDTSQQKPPSRSPFSAQDVTRKRPRIKADNTMEQDHALAPTNTSAPPVPVSNSSQNTAAPTSQVSVPNTSSSPSCPSPSAGSPDNFLNASQHALVITRLLLNLKAKIKKFLSNNVLSLLTLLLQPYKLLLLDFTYALLLTLWKALMINLKLIETHVIRSIVILPTFSLMVAVHSVLAPMTKKGLLSFFALNLIWNLPLPLPFLN